MDYSFQKSLLAAGKDLAHSLVGVVGAAALVYLGDPAHFAAFVDAVPTAYAVPVGLALSALAAFFRNLAKNYNR